MNSEDNCYTPGKIVHELMHSYGIYHEHLRPDREKYIEIMHDNILDYSKNIQKFMKMSHISTHNVEYDGKSIMHYSANYLSNGNGPTMRSVITYLNKYSCL